LTASCLFAPTPVQASASAVVGGEDLFVEQSTGRSNGELLESLLLDHEITTDGQDGSVATAGLPHVVSAETTFFREGAVVVNAPYYHDNNHSDSGLSDGDDQCPPTKYTTGSVITSTSTEAREDGLEQEPGFRGPAIAEITGDRPAQSPYLFGGQLPKTMSSEESTPLYTLPPKEWIRSHLGTKSPYPHESRPVGLLRDTPKGHELVQLHLVRSKKKIIRQLINPYAILLLYVCMFVCFPSCSYWGCL
jgi:hypothetical protein